MLHATCYFEQEIDEKMLFLCKKAYTRSLLEELESVHSLNAMHTFLCGS